MVIFTTQQPLENIEIALRLRRHRHMAALARYGMVAPPLPEQAADTKTGAGTDNADWRILGRCTVTNLAIVLTSFQMRHRQRDRLKIIHQVKRIQPQPLAGFADRERPEVIGHFKAVFFNRPGNRNAGMTHRRVADPAQIVLYGLRNTGIIRALQDRLFTDPFRIGQRKAGIGRPDIRD